MIFVRKHGLWSDQQKDAAERLRHEVNEQKLHSIRLSFPDKHGILRGKTLMVGEAINSIESGCSITTTLLAKDTSHRTVFPVFSAGGGFRDERNAGWRRCPDGRRSDHLQGAPWAPGTGWVLCDLYFADGRPVPFASRGLYRSVLERLAARGSIQGGLESMSHFQGRASGLGPMNRPSRPARRATGGQPAVTRLPVSHRAALRPDGARFRSDPAKYRGAWSTVALD